MSVGFLVIIAAVVIVGLFAAGWLMNSGGRGGGR